MSPVSNRHFGATKAGCGFLCDLADALDCDRRTVTRALETLEAAGLIERRIIVTRVAGSPRADSLARLTADLEDNSWPCQLCLSTGCSDPA